MVENLVVCISQLGINLGNEIYLQSKNNQKYSSLTSSSSNSYSSSSYSSSSSFIFIDNNKEILQNNSNNLNNLNSFLTNYIYYENKSYNWKNSYNNCELIIDYLIRKLENYDNLQNITLLYDISNELGTGISKYLTEYLTECIPGLLITHLGILPHYYSNSRTCLNTIIAIQSAFENNCNCILRCLDESEYILDSIGMYSDCIGFDTIYKTMATDLINVVVRPTQLTSISDTFSCRKTLIDVRSSQWSSYLQNKSKVPRDRGINQEKVTSNSNKNINTNTNTTNSNNNTKRSSSTPRPRSLGSVLLSSSSSIATTTTTTSSTSSTSFSKTKSIVSPEVIQYDKLMRYLSMNIHSLHVSNSMSCSNLLKSHFTSLISSKLYCYQTSEMSELSRFNQVLNGSTQGIQWETNIPVEFHDNREMVLYFQSPYGKNLLKNCYDNGRKCHQVGAYHHKKSIDQIQDENIALDLVDEYLQVM